MPAWPKAAYSLIDYTALALVQHVYGISELLPGVVYKNSIEALLLKCEFHNFAGHSGLAAEG